MKSLLVLFILSLQFSLSYAQIISKKTNAIKVNSRTTEATEYPNIEWIKPFRDDTGTELTDFDIKVTLTSASEITSAILYLKSASASKSIDIPEGSKEFTFEQNIRLLGGANTIEIIVKNKQGMEAKGIRTIRSGKNNNLLDSDRKDYALLIATNNYDNMNDLTNPIYDAETIGKKLADKYGFQVDLLKNPSKEDIILAIRKFAIRSFKDQDQLFIFIAGHGIYDPTLGDGYIVTKESLKSDPSRTSYLAYASLRQYINNINCKHLFVTLDVCFGGTFDDKLTTKRSAYDAPEGNEWLSRKLALTTRRYLTSGGEEYVPDGSPGSHSPFAKKFIEALSTNGHEDQVLTLAEMLVFFERLDPIPRSGSWGDNESGSDFLFMVRN